MNETPHKLILDYHRGRLQARCGCGGWAEAPVLIGAGRLRDAYDRIEEEHCRHVEEAESREFALA